MRTTRTVAVLFITLLSQASCIQRTRHEVGVPPNAVIAHRGLSYWAPEETAPAFELARDLGADYLEADIQRTKDGVLVCFHDDDLSRTTNASDVFPGREKDPISTFTLAELKSLDAGSWFNREREDRARFSFVGLKILTLDELIDIAEDIREGRPGICLETKKPELYPGIERDLKKTLASRGWDGRDLSRRLLLQTFARDSLVNLNKEFPGVPKILLLWRGEGHIEDDKPETYEEALDFAVSNGA
ncbi:MAG: glycerophosphodiester phosphodiesterase family protein, partial [Planctomycetota bacterium]